VHDHPCSEGLPATYIVNGYLPGAVEVPIGAYDVRATAGSFVLARNLNLTLTSDELAEQEVSKRIRLLLEPGGAIAIASPALHPDSAVQLLSLRTGRADTVFLARERELPFPAGDVVAIGFLAPGEYAGITLPFALHQDEIHEIHAFHAPRAGTGDVLVAAESGPTVDYERDVLLVLRAGERVFRPGAATYEVAKEHFFYFVFYDVPEGTYTLTAESNTFTMTPAALHVSAGKLNFPEGYELFRKPIIVADRECDPPGETSSWTTKILTCPEPEVMNGTRLAPESGACRVLVERASSDDRQVLGPFDAGLYYLQAARLGHEEGRWVDLRSPGDHRETFSFEKMRFEGAITRGKRPISADIELRDLRTDHVLAHAQASADGVFSTHLWSPADAVVSITPVPGSPDETKEFTVVIPRGATFRQAFVIPDTQWHAHVFNERSSQPIPKASVQFASESGQEQRLTDQEGNATLPPMPAGGLKVGVIAAGFERVIKQVELADTTAEQAFEFPMRPVEDQASITLLLSDGRPAWGGRLLRLDQSGEPITVECDDQGVCRFGEPPAGGITLYGIHPEGGLTPFLAEEAVRRRSVALLAGVGALSLRLHRGPLTREANLLVQVEIGGALIPTRILQAAASYFGQVATPYSFSHREAPVLLYGLPGSPIRVSFLRLGEGGGPAAQPSPIPGDAPHEISVLSPTVTFDLP
jgi:hypothetical protein